MKRAHPLLTALLLVVFAVTGVTMAVARGQAPVAQWVEICAGHGTAVLALDAQGRPVDPGHICPDCLAGCAAVMPELALAGGLLRPDTQARRLVVAPVALADGRDGPAPRARGPPFVS